MFKKFSKLGQAFMLPIAILPVAGLLLGLGAALTNEAATSMFPFLNQPWLQGILKVMNGAGNAVFANLPLIFSVGIAVGLAKADKGTAGLSAAVAFLVFTASISVYLELFSPEGTSIDTGVLGALVIGLTVTWLHNRYRKIVLPQFLAFFGGNRFIPIVSALVSILIASIFYLIWPPVQNVLVQVGEWIASLGSIGSFFYGFFLRLTGAVGLHHTIYPLFWYTSLGGTETVAGQVISGAQNIYFAQLADASHTGLYTYGTRFFAGRFATMMFGLPAACFGMYHAIPKKNRANNRGFYISSALTSFLTGITEPIEFSFLFAAPWLYVIHAFLDGVSFLVADLLKIRIGNTFSGGLIDFTLFGPMQGNAQTNWILVLPVGLAWAFLYYMVFKFFVGRYKIAVPGMLEEEDQAGDATQAVSASTPLHERSMTIIQALGSPSNIENVTACATRLRVAIKDASLVDKALLKKTGATAVLDVQNGLQAIYGGQSNVYSAEINEILDLGTYTDASASPASQDVEAKGSTEARNAGGEDGAQAAKKVQEESLLSPGDGQLLSLEEVKDTAFSSKVLGQGFALRSEDGKIYAPVAGKILSVFPTKHALGLLSEGGAEILIHMGLDTVALKGKGFSIAVQEGDRVQAGQLLATMDLSTITAAGYDPIIPVVVTNSADYSDFTLLRKGGVQKGDQVFHLK